MVARSAVATVVVALVLVMAPLQGGASAVKATQVQGLTVEQGEGFASLRWDPVAGASEYVITRTPVDGDGLPAGLPVVAGVWRANRQVRPEAPSFADAGFVPGGRYQWRVAAAPTPPALPALPSDPVTATTRPLSGPEEFRTAFESSGGTTYTPYEDELTWTQAIDQASDRVRVVELGRTAQDRAINLFVIGHPAPLPTAEAISRSPSVAVNCIVHGNEPSGREACFQLVRELAFSDDPWVVDILSHATVLVIPSFNGDGRAADTRGNVTGQDLNRDYGRLSQPETHTMVRFWRDYSPEVMTDHHEYGNADSCDLPLMNTPHLNNAQVMYDEARYGLIEGWLYDRGAEDGWWQCPYPVAFSAGGQSFGSTTGLKHIVATLVEARSTGGPTRPDEAAPANNQLRKVASQLWIMRQSLDYHRANQARVEQVIEASIAWQTSNIGPIVFDGTRDWEAQPAPHPNQSPPPNNRPGEGDVLNEPPCGYLLTDQQYRTPLADGGSLPAQDRTTPEQRLASHGIEVVDLASGDHLVPMTQPFRGLIPLILDGQAGDLGIPIIVAAERLYDCP